MSLQLTCQNPATASFDFSSLVAMRVLNSWCFDTFLDKQVFKTKFWSTIPHLFTIYLSALQDIYVGRFSHKVYMCNSLGTLELDRQNSLFSNCTTYVVLLINNKYNELLSEMQSLKVS